MKLKILKAKPIESRLTATIHFNGRLGFSSAAVKKMDLRPNSYLKIAIDEDDKKIENIYLMVVEKVDEETYKIIKAGDYLYINPKLLFDELNFDYKGKKIIFDVSEEKNAGDKIFKLNRRERDRKRANN